MFKRLCCWQYNIIISFVPGIIFSCFQTFWCANCPNYLHRYSWNQWILSQHEVHKLCMQVIFLNTLVYVKWNRIPTSYSGGPKRSTRDAHATFRSDFFHFHAGFGQKFGPNNPFRFGVWLILEQYLPSVLYRTYVILLSIIASTASFSQ